jgi:hypothetical protein
MASYARLAVSVILAGCSPRVIDAVVADETCCADGGRDGAREAGVDAEPANISDATGTKLLVHRYSFAGPAGVTAVKDTGFAGGGDALIYNAQLSGADYLELPGGLATLIPAYVDLPNFLISKLDRVTLEIWVAWDGPIDASSQDDWQRIFDFGEDFSGADLDAAPRPNPGNRSRDGRSYLYLTPMSADAAGSNLRVAYLKPEDMVPRQPEVTFRETQVSAALPLAVGGLQQIDVTIDGQMSLYLGGARIGQPQLLPGTLADIYDINCWLGRSQFPVDPIFRGRIYEFRVYNKALTPEEIAKNASRGYAMPGVE